jgi:hypothetical protein
MPPKTDEAKLSFLQVLKKARQKALSEKEDEKEEIEVWGEAIKKDDGEIQIAKFLRVKELLIKRASLGPGWARIGVDFLIAVERGSVDPITNRKMNCRCINCSGVLHKGGIGAFSGDTGIIEAFDGDGHLYARYAFYFEKDSFTRNIRDPIPLRPWETE